MIQVVKFFCFASFSHMSMRKTYAQVCVSQIGSEQNCSVARRQTICKLPSIKTAKRLDIPNDPTICSYAEHSFHQSMESTHQRNKKVSKQYNTHIFDTSQKGGPSLGPNLEFLVDFEGHVGSQNRQNFNIYKKMGKRSKFDSRLSENSIFEVCEHLA